MSSVDAAGLAAMLGGGKPTRTAEDFFGLPRAGLAATVARRDASGTHTRTCSVVSLFATDDARGRVDPAACASLSLVLLLHVNARGGRFQVLQQQLLG